MPRASTAVQQTRSRGPWLSGLRPPTAGLFWALLRGTLVVLCADYLFTGTSSRSAAPMFAQAAPATAPRYTNKPRVRREWRTLSEDMRQRVAKAFWTLKTLTEEEGQAKYGKDFHNYDNMVVVHTCATFDPRCDQGHYGPHLLTFHRLWLLKVEKAMLAVDPSIEAIPYWDLTLDGVNGAYRNDPEKYIFTDKFLGSFMGTGPNHVVEDGLFARWPIAQFTEEVFGKTGKLAETSQCIREGYFKWRTATTCDRCCLSADPCTCGSNDTYPTYLRNHDDCTPWLARHPKDPTNRMPNLGGSEELFYTEEDFQACTDPQNVQSWMEWQLCIELSFIACRTTSGKLAVALRQHDLPPAVGDVGTKANGTAAGEACTYYDFVGYYKNRTSGQREYVHSLHSVVHAKTGRDMLDVSTSPNDVGIFVGYHANIDRSNLHWVAAHEELRSSLAKKYFLYPSSQQDLTGSSGDAPYGFSGPNYPRDKILCKDTVIFSQFNAHGGPWLNGTTADEVANGAFGFVDLFSCSESEDCSGRAKGGYTHAEAIYWMAPERAPYTYDTLEHLYYDLP